MPEPGRQRRLVHRRGARVAPGVDAERVDPDPGDAALDQQRRRVAAVARVVERVAEVARRRRATYASQPVQSRTAAPAGIAPCSASHARTSPAASVHAGSPPHSARASIRTRRPDELLGRDVGHARAARHAVDRRVQVGAAVLGEVEVARPVALLVVGVGPVGAERHRARPEHGALAERLREVEDLHADESNGRSKSVDRTICVCVRVTPGWSRIRSSASSRCDVSRARTWMIALASPATV